MGFVSDIVEGVADAIGDVVEGAIDIVSDIGSGIDDMVHDIIPGGWAGVGALGLLAIGIADPTLLGLAEEGALTSEALASAGVDAAAVATDVAAVAPEVMAATEAAVTSGITPELIAAANATADPIAALNAAAGWTTADTAYLATIGATPELIAAAEANNATLAAGGTPGGAAGGTTGEAATGGATEGGATTTTTPTTTEPTTQVFDDGSTLTTNPDGTISATDINGNPTQTLVSPGGPGQAPVYDASGTAVPGAGAGTPDPTLLQGAKDLATGIYDTLGPLGTAALGLGAASLLTPQSNLGGPVQAGDVKYEWGQGIPLQTGPLNAGLLQQTASTPFYQSTNPTDAQYYWGAHNVVNTPEDVANYNNIPSAPKTPWGAGPTAVGGQARLDAPGFVNQYITNPNWAGVNAGTSPGYTPPAAPVAPEPQVIPMSLAQQALASRSNSGAPTAQLTAGPAVPA